MYFEWDEQKRRINFNNHKVDFVEACRIFDGFTLEYEDPRYRYDEERFIAIGEVNQRVLTVIYTWRGDIIRLISARKATKDERKAYYSRYY